MDFPMTPVPIQPILSIAHSFRIFMILPIQKNMVPLCPNFAETDRFFISHFGWKDTKEGRLFSVQVELGCVACIHQ
jgi:hypothetical protein